MNSISTTRQWISYIELDVNIGIGGINTFPGHSFVGSTVWNIATFSYLDV